MNYIMFVSYTKSINYYYSLNTKHNEQEILLYRNSANNVISNVINFYFVYLCLTILPTQISSETERQGGNV